MEKTKIAPKDLTMMGLMTAVMCVLAPISIPMPGLVPLSLGTLVIYFYPYLLGTKKAALCCTLYIALGIIGLPVFSGYMSGLPKVLGPTGGYMFGYYFIIFFLGQALKHFENKRLVHAAAIVVGTAGCYLFGTLWLSYLMKITFAKALGAGVIPFIPGDIIKAVITMLVAPAICNRLQRAGLMPSQQV